MPDLKPLSLAFIFFILGCAQTPPTEVEDDCACPLGKVKTVERGGSSSGVTRKADGEAALLIDIPYIKKFVNAELQLSGGIEKVSEASEKVYWEILHQNPDITQYANLFQLTTCALYRVACEDGTITEAEQEREKRAIIRAFEARLDVIVENSMKENDKDAPPKPTAPSTNTKSSSPPPKQAPRYFTNNQPVDIAMLVTGDKSYKNFGDALGNWLSFEQGMKVNTGLFTPAFTGAFLPRLRSRDMGVFNETGAGRLANCVCLFDQQSKLQESEMAGEKFITAIFSGRITLFNLREQTQASFSFEERGAGVTIALAMESVEEKLQLQFANLINPLSACK